MCELLNEKNSERFLYRMVTNEGKPGKAKYAFIEIHALHFLGLAGCDVL